ncbi:MAG: hypothetical protein EPN92_14105, partial [Chitinophagaceae bacterium]
MRVKNEDGELKIYAVAGCQTLLLAFDIDKSKVTAKGFMGFRIERTDSKGKKKILNGTKLFASDDPANPKQKLSPIQSYLWKDYLVDAGETYTYKAEAMLGTWDNMNPGFSASITIATEPQQDGEHSVYFNFGVTGSQAYAKFAKDLPQKSIDKLSGANREKAFAILGRELWTDGLKKFVAQAKGPKDQLLCAFYEAEYSPFFDLLKKAKDKGVDVKIVYSGKPAQSKNKTELKRAGLLSVSKERTNQVSQPHNKFIVLVQNNKPKQVWTGSTNITIRGIFGHCNTGHWVVNDAIAKKYKDYWEMLVTNPAKQKFNDLTKSIQADLDGKNLTKGTKVIFSPRKTADMLGEYVKTMDQANQAVCIIYPFNIEKIFKDFYAEDRGYLRFIITDKGGDKTDFVTNDKDVIKTQGAILDSHVEQWVEEITSKATTGASTLYVHNKFFIVDPLSASPVVITGSANFSDESLTNNDENMLVIKGNKRVADIYFGEFARLFDHFLPRYLQKKNEEEGNAPTAG